MTARTSTADFASIAFENCSPIMNSTAPHRGRPETIGPIPSGDRILVLTTIGRPLLLFAEQRVIAAQANTTLLSIGAKRQWLSPRDMEAPS